jgi:hypothetical protein
MCTKNTSKLLPETKQLLYNEAQGEGSQIIYIRTYVYTMNPETNMPLKSSPAKPAPFTT